MTSTGEPLSPDEVEEVRAATPFDPDRIHLNHAGASPSSAAVLATQIDHLRRDSEIGGYEAAAERAEADAAVYGSIAALLGCQPTEIARHEHATSAWNAGFWSVPMQPGQRILTAEAAYGANAVGFLHAERSRGVRVEVMPSDESGQVDVAALADRVDDDVALIAITHVPRGPRGSGFLYAAASIVDRLIPATPDHHGADWSGGRTYRLAAGARRFEHWEYNHAAWLALGAAVDEARAIGLDRIEATIRTQAEALRAALEAAGFQVFDLGHQRCGIVTTAVPDVPSAEAKGLLAAAGINVSVSDPDSTRWDAERRRLDPMLRLSVHISTTGDDIDRAVGALQHIAVSRSHSMTPLE